LIASVTLKKNAIYLPATEYRTAIPNWQTDASRPTDTQNLANFEASAMSTNDNK
jgi:hypothetical protein